MANLESSSTNTPSPNLPGCANNCTPNATAANRRDASGYRNLGRPKSDRWAYPQCATGPSRQLCGTYSNRYLSATSPSTATVFGLAADAGRQWDAWKNS